MRRCEITKARVSFEFEYVRLLARSPIDEQPQRRSSLHLVRRTQLIPILCVREEGVSVQTFEHILVRDIPGTTLDSSVAVSLGASAITAANPLNNQDESSNRASPLECDVLVEMPVNVARRVPHMRETTDLVGLERKNCLPVKEPRSGIVCDKTDGDVVCVTAYGHGVAPDWIHKVRNVTTRYPHNIKSVL